jgi:hypothetical protein
MASAQGTNFVAAPAPAPAPTLLCSKPKLFSKAQQLTQGLGLLFSMIFSDFKFVDMNRKCIK